MINKNNLWFLTLFCLVVVLSIYYVTMPDELLVTNNNDTITTDNSSSKDMVNDDNDEVVTNVSESDVISALKVEDDNKSSEQIADIKDKLSDANTTATEKNAAFEELKLINKNITLEETIEEKLKTEMDLNAFVKIEKDQVRVVVGDAEANTNLANKIMRFVQTMFDTKMYISVQFNS